MDLSGSNLARVGVQDTDLYIEYERCWPWLRKALKRSGDFHNKQSLWELLRLKKAQLWGSKRGAAVSYIQVYPCRKILELWLIGGDFEQVQADWHDEFRRFGKDKGCDAIRVHARKGWERRAAPFGYEKVGVILQEKL